MSADLIRPEVASVEHLSDAPIAVLQLCLHHVHLLKDSLAGAAAPQASPSNPSVEFQYPVSWAFDDQGKANSVAHEGWPTEASGNTALFEMLTNGAGWSIRNGTARPLVTAEQKSALEELPTPERHQLLDTITEPFTLVLGQETRSESSGRQNLVSLLVDVARPHLSDGAVTFSLVLEVHPLVVDHDQQRAYYPVITSLQFDPNSVASVGTLAEHGSALWDVLTETIGRFISTVQGVSGCVELVAKAAALPEPIVGPRVTYPERRRSVMSPVPMPRAAGKEAAALAGIRGLGRIFAGYSKTPDLDLRGVIAVDTAAKLLWSVVEEQLRVLGCEYRRTDEGGRTVYSIRDCRTHQGNEIWASVERALNKGDGGPGIEAQRPSIESASRFENGSIISETRLVFWPGTAGAPQPGNVRFRSEGSPGYVALLERQEYQPFFADGFLWIKRGRLFEGFRIGGLSTMLFQEGRAALVRSGEGQIATFEGDLNRMLRDPHALCSLDEKATQQLRGEIDAIRRWLAGLSVFDVSHDLILCLLEAFYHQRDRWVRQELVLAGKRTISTAPYRVLRLEPHELRLRVDPARKWGKNWRARLFDRLAALATFERQTRTEFGRKVDVGDRLVHRVIDGLAVEPNRGRPESDAGGVSLLTLLRYAGAIPSDGFFVEVSVDFMASLITWAVDAKGVVRWGLDAVMKDDQARNEDLPEGDPLPGRQPYYTHSPRLLALSNLEDWSPTRKLLASALLQEVTPGGQRGGRRTQNPRAKLTVRIDGQEYVSCNGARGHGYRVRTWIERSGHDPERAPSASLRQLTGDIEALNEAIRLRIELRNKQGTTGGSAAIRLLGSLVATPEDAMNTILRAYLPADLEAHLREQLSARAQFEACETEEDAARGTMSGNDLRSLRGCARLTQAEVAAAIGVSKMAISQWEQGKYPIPAERRERLAAVLASAEATRSKAQVTKSPPE